MTERELRIFRAIADDLRALRQDIHAIREQREAHPEHPIEEPVRPVQIEVQIEPITQAAIREYYEAENHKRDSWWGRHESKITTSGVGIAFVLASLTLLTMCEIHKQTPAVIQSANTATAALKANHEQFEIDERAYVSITKFGFPPTIEQVSSSTITLDQIQSNQWPKVGEWITINIFFTNSGKSTASDVRTDYHAVFGAKAKRGCFAFVNTDTLDARRGTGNGIGSGKFIWSTAVSIEDDLHFPTKMIKWTGERPVLIYAIIAYRDIFDHTHRSKSCVEYLPGPHTFQLVPGQTWIDYQ